ncbi:hypothetical protein EUX98_g7755 [Antrodiella citrinella]|uniref:Inhibitor of growth protein N-terminal histone-binding domain-containing protein n=1 Tax=Antrodiella citrinella TaxID=2447956 RepID=A0A4V3XHU5_9APHY|nr:hypothetical protein EUX98_g7755 [Antrodiella citrinella]
MVPRPVPVSGAPSASTPHSLAMLTEYTHTIDSLPLDLSRNFADLRELDAVLSSSMHILTSKITTLTSMIENKTASKEERLWLLAEIAEEAGRLKPGADDKIRVACHAADGLSGHKAHMTMLLEHMPDPQFGRLAGMLGRKTVYPHVATRSYMPAGMTGEGGRRVRRNAYGSLLARDANEVTPAKRKRVARDDDGDVTRSPRKDRTGDPARGRGGNGRARKCVSHITPHFALRMLTYIAFIPRVDRAASPAPSELSVASHIPPVNTNQPISAPTRPANISRQSATVSNVKRGRGGHAHTPSNLVEAIRDSTPRPPVHNAPPSASHPSLPTPYNTPGAQNVEAGVARAIGNGEWAHGQLEGPGMPVARNFVGANSTIASSSANKAPGQSTEPTGEANAEGEGEQDDNRRYCFCNGVSFGEMIGCDDANCELEWVRLF